MKITRAAAHHVGIALGGATFVAILVSDWMQISISEFGRVVEITVFAVSIGLISVRRGNVFRRALNALFSSLVLWISWASAFSAIRLLQFGDWDEGGPALYFLGIGFYIALPIAASSMLIAATLGVFLKSKL